MNNEYYKQQIVAYSQLEKQIQLIQTQQSEIKHSLIPLMQADDLKNVTDKEVGRFSMGPRRTYEFSSAVKELKGQLDKKRAEEKAKGIATFTEEMGISFFARKELNGK